MKRLSIYQIEEQVRNKVLKRQERLILHNHSYGFNSTKDSKKLNLLKQRCENYFFNNKVKCLQDYIDCEADEYRLFDMELNDIETDEMPTYWYTNTYGAGYDDLGDTLNIDCAGLTFGDVTVKNKFYLDGFDILVDSNILNNDPRFSVGWIVEVLILVFNDIKHFRCLDRISVVDGKLMYNNKLVMIKFCCDILNMTVAEYIISQTNLSKSFLRLFEISEIWCESYTTEVLYSVMGRYTMLDYRKGRVYQLLDGDLDKLENGVEVGLTFNVGKYILLDLESKIPVREIAWSFSEDVRPIQVSSQMWLNDYMITSLSVSYSDVKHEDVFQRMMRHADRMSLIDLVVYAKERLELKITLSELVHQRHVKLHLTDQMFNDVVSYCLKHDLWDYYITKKDLHDGKECTVLKMSRYMILVNYVANIYDTIREDDLTHVYSLEGLALLLNNDQYYSDEIFENIEYRSSTFNEC